MKSGPETSCSYVFRLREWMSERGVSEPPADVPDEWSCHHPAVDGHERCQFHRPASETDPDGERQALIEAVLGTDSPVVDRKPRFLGATLTHIDLESASIDLQHNHPLDFRCVDVDGDVNVRNATFRQALSLDAAVIEGDVAGHDVTVEDEMTAVGMRVRGDVELSNARFGDNVRLSGARIDGETVFTTAEFDADTFFIETEFGGEVSGHHAAFSGELNFSGADMANDVWLEDLRVGGAAGFSSLAVDGQLQLERARFIGNCWVVHSTIEEGVHFDGVRFGAAFDFSDTRIRGDTAYFRQATFEGAVDFENASFEVDVDFSDARFRGVASFAPISTGGPAVFADTRFERDALFIGSTFGDSVGFHRARLDADLDFSGVSVRGDGMFEDLSVGGTMGFSRVRVDGQVQLERSQFRNNCWFVRTVVGGGIDFEDATFGSKLHARRAAIGGGTARFAEARFEGEVDFGNAVFAEGADFSNARFFARSKLQPAYFGDGTTFSDAQFRRETHFIESQFDGDVYFRRTSFENGSDFSGARIRGDGWFEDLTAADSVGFSRVVVDGQAQFERSSIDGQVYLKFTTIEESLHFNQSSVGSNGQFERVTVGGRTDFERATFGGGLDFVGGEFAGNVSLDGVTVHSELCLGGIRVSPSSRVSMAGSVLGTLVVSGRVESDETVLIDLSDSRIDGGSLSHPARGTFVYDLENARLGTVRIDDTEDGNALEYFRFDNTSFDGFDFGNHNSQFSAAGWEIHTCIEDAPFEPLSPAATENTYLKAKNGAKQVGATKAAAEFFIQQLHYRRKKHSRQFLDAPFRTESLGSLRRWAGNLVLSFSSGYGERPAYVVALSAATIGVFALLFAALLPTQPYGSPLGYLILSSESFVTLLLGGATTVENPWIRLLAQTEGFLGAFLIALFVFTLTRSIDR